MSSLSDDYMGRALIEFFESQGCKFVDVSSGKPLVEDKLTLCKTCQCMTKTYLTGKCTKCGTKKGTPE